MGGLGSGRPWGGGRITAESCRSLDINKLHRVGVLSPPWTGGWAWWDDDGEQVASIGLRMREGFLALSYRSRSNGGDWQDIEETVPILRAPCRFGGSRPYFECPGIVNGIHCGRRVAKLFGPGKYFLCRHCYRIAYASQSEGRMDRAIRRANKIRTRLGGEQGAVWAPSTKHRPKGMWQRTYERLQGELIDAEMSADQAFTDRVSALFPNI